MLPASKITPEHKIQFVDKPTSKIQDLPRSTQSTVRAGKVMLSTSVTKHLKWKNDVCVCYY